MAAAVVSHAAGAPSPPPGAAEIQSPNSDPMPSAASFPLTSESSVPSVDLLASGEFDRLLQLEQLLGRLQAELGAAETCLAGVDSNYRSVAGATDQIREQCAELVERWDRLEERTDRLREHLRCFELLEQAGRQLQGWRPGQPGLTSNLVQLGETLRASLGYLQQLQQASSSNIHSSSGNAVRGDGHSRQPSRNHGHQQHQQQPHNQQQQSRSVVPAVRGARDAAEYLNLGRCLLQRFCRMAESHFAFCLNAATEPAVRKMERSLQFLVQQPEKYLPLDLSTVRRQLQAAHVTDAESFLQVRQVLTAFRPLLRQLPEPSRQQLAQVYRARRRQVLQLACQLIFRQHERLARLRTDGAGHSGGGGGGGPGDGGDGSGGQPGAIPGTSEEPSGLWNLPESLRSQAHALIQLCGREFQLHQDFFGSSTPAEDTPDNPPGVESQPTSSSPAFPGVVSPAAGEASPAGLAPPAHTPTTPMPLIQQFTADLAFPESAAFDELLEEGLAGPFYQHLRPQIIQLQGLDLLCEAILVLRTELLDDQLLPRGRSVTSLAAGVQRLIQDTQQRLAYRAQIHIRDHIRGFRGAAAAEDYPMRLFCPAEVDPNNPEPPVTPSLTSGYRLVGPYRFRGQLLAVAQLQAQAAHGSAWHPVLRVTLMLLSQLYRCMEGPVFRLLAQQAVVECVRQLQRVAQEIQRRQGELQQAHRQLQQQRRDDQKLPPSQLELTFGPLPQQEQLPHALFFLLQHLLALRQQISPFRVDLSSTELQLDFSELLGSMSRVLLVRPSQWSMLFRRLIRSPAPGALVSERRSDSRQELEALLRHVCERLITGGAQLLVGDLVRVLDAGDEQQRLLSLRQAQPPGSSEPSPPQPQPQQPSHQSPALSQEHREHALRVLELLRQMASGSSDRGDRFQQRLLAYAHGLFLYLGDAGSEQLLLAPVKQTILEALAQIPGRLGMEQETLLEQDAEASKLRMEILEAISSLRELIEAV